MESRKEIILHGIAASPGIVIGKAYVFAKQAPRIEDKSIADEEVVNELARLQHSIERSEKELQKVL